MDDIAKKMVEKSIEAFIMGIEIYNKPTIKYRVEGFSFFICNAWELMLKAQMLNVKKSIYYKDNPDRTLSLHDVIQRVYPDKNTKLRLNLEKIIDLRNISTHYITQDYETKYAPLFQACVINFINQLNRFHNENITDYIPQNFLAISASYEQLTNEQIKVKYPPEIAEKFIKKANEIDVLSEEYHSDKFSINIKQNLLITKKSSEADFKVKISNKSNNNVEIVKDLKDPSDTHKYSYKSVIEVVKERLKKRKILLDYSKGFNSYVLNMIIDFYDIKKEKKYAYKHVIGKQSSYTYSQQFIDFIINEIKKDPQHFVENLKKAYKK